MPTLLTSIGLLVFLSLGTVLAIQWLSSGRVMTELGGALINNRFNQVETELRKEFQSAKKASQFITKSLQARAYDQDNPTGLTDLFKGVMIPVEYITGIVYVRPDFQGIGVLRNAQGDLETNLFNVQENLNSRLYNIVINSRDRRQPFWGPPVYSALLKQTLLGLRTPIHREDEYLGFLAISISIEALSELTAKLQVPDLSTVFVLFGENNVIAHPNIQSGLNVLSGERPLPSRQDISDPVIRSLHLAEPFNRPLIKAPEGTELLALNVEDQDYLIFRKEINEFGDFPVILGFYGLQSSVGAPIRILIGAIAVGILLLIIALVLAAVIARLISRPVGRTAERANTIANLDFENLPPLPPSQFRELNDLASSFNIMTEGLKLFGRYVPRTLVQHLMREGDSRVRSEERELTVMFTDIVGFATLCEEMNASEVAQFINHHIEIVAKCIVAHEGTIDKYIGDAVMAFWGAPNQIKNSALSAAQAALMIKAETARDNEIRVSRGELPIKMRIGLHTGPLIVGDIGSQDRINYTVVGDAVNVAQRLEALGKEVSESSDCVILLSEETVKNLPEDFHVTPQGAYNVKGRAGKVEIYSLD